MIAENKLASQALASLMIVYKSKADKHMPGCYLHFYKHFSQTLKINYKHLAKLCKRPMAYHEYVMQAIPVKFMMTK